MDIRVCVYAGTTMHTNGIPILNYKWKDNIPNRFNATATTSGKGHSVKTSVFVTNWRV